MSEWDEIQNDDAANDDELSLDDISEMISDSDDANIIDSSPNKSSAPISLGHNQNPPQVLRTLPSQKSPAKHAQAMGKLANQRLTPKAIPKTASTPLGKGNLRGTGLGGIGSGLGRGAGSRGTRGALKGALRSPLKRKILKFVIPVIIIIAIILLVVIILIAVSIGNIGSSGQGEIEQSSGTFIPSANIAGRDAASSTSSGSSGGITVEGWDGALLRQGDYDISAGSFSIPKGGCWITSYAMIWSRYSGTLHTPEDVVNGYNDGTLSPAPFLPGSGLGVRGNIGPSLENLNIGLQCELSDGSINMSTVDEVLNGGGCVFQYREGTHSHATVIVGKVDDTTYQVADPAYGEIKEYQIDRSSGTMTDSKGAQPIAFAIYCRKS